MILKFIKILIIEDEFNLADTIRSMLLSVNYGVQDLIILDVMLLYKNGFEMIIKRSNIHNKKEVSMKNYGMLIMLLNGTGTHNKKRIEIIVLRYQKDKIKDKVDNQELFVGYHMNKENWMTIKLDESVDIKEIYKWIDNSYNLAFKK